MNYFNIFASLESDSKGVGTSIDKLGVKKYFTENPTLTLQKQAWLIKRVLELEGTPTGKAVIKREREIKDLKEAKQLLTSEINDLKTKITDNKQEITDLKEKLKAERIDWVKRFSDRETQIINFYHPKTPADRTQILGKNANLENKINGLTTDKLNLSQEVNDLKVEVKQLKADKLLLIPFENKNKQLVNENKDLHDAIDLRNDCLSVNIEKANDIKRDLDKLYMLVWNKTDDEVGKNRVDIEIDINNAIKKVKDLQKKPF